jgi:hypothetical protein
MSGKTIFPQETLIGQFLCQKVFIQLKELFFKIFSAKKLNLNPRNNEETNKKATSLK